MELSWWMFTPLILTARASALSLAPWQTGHGSWIMYRSMSLRTQSDSVFLYLRQSQGITPSHQGIGETESGPLKSSCLSTPNRTRFLNSSGSWPQGASMSTPDLLASSASLRIMVGGGSP